MKLFFWDNLYKLRPDWLLRPTPGQTNKLCLVHLVLDLNIFLQKIIQECSSSLQNINMPLSHLPWPAHQPQSNNTMKRKLSNSDITQYQVF